MIFPAPRSFWSRSAQANSIANLLIGHLNVESIGASSTWFYLSSDPTTGSIRTSLRLRPRLAVDAVDPVEHSRDGGRDPAGNLSSDRDYRDAKGSVVVAACGLQLN